MYFLQISQQWTWFLYFLFQRQTESADNRAVNIFKKMDVNSDGVVTRSPEMMKSYFRDNVKLTIFREEFVSACLADTSLMQMLTPQTG